MRVLCVEKVSGEKVGLLIFELVLQGVFILKMLKIS